MAKQKPLKKDRLAGKKLYQTERKKPFYAQMQPRQKQKPKKNHPFGDGWEIADDYEEEMIPAGEYQDICSLIDGERCADRAADWIAG